MEAAAAAPRPRLLLLVLAAAATLVPEVTGERRRGGTGGRPRGARTGPGLWLAPSLSQTWRGAGGAGGGAWAGAGLSCSGRRHASRGWGAEAGLGPGSERGWTCPAARGRPGCRLSGGSGVGRSRPGSGAALWGASGRGPTAGGCEAGRDRQSWDCSLFPSGRCVALSRAPHPERVGAPGSGVPGGIGVRGGFQGGV